VLRFYMHKLCGSRLRLLYGMCRQCLLSDGAMFIVHHRNGCLHSCLHADTGKRDMHLHEHFNGVFSFLYRVPSVCWNGC
jgi:hypothetical protein